jgi:hypothetical protein
MEEEDVRDHSMVRNGGNRICERNATLGNANRNLGTLGVEAPLNARLGERI